MFLQDKKKSNIFYKHKIKHNHCVSVQTKYLRVYSTYIQIYS